VTATHEVQRRRLLVTGAKIGLATVVASWIGAAFAHATAEPSSGSGTTAGDGAQLFFVRVGEGPLMVFLHGHPDGALLYESQLKEFGRDHLAVAPNLRGYPPIGRA
jgi:hypothetical protein